MEEAQEKKYVLDENRDIVEDERIALPDSYYKLLNEAVNDLYKKVTDENEALVNWHKNGGPVAVFRPSYELQTARTGEAGMLLQWFRANFKIAE